MWQGSLLAIHTAPELRVLMTAHQTANLRAGIGIEGDRYALGTGKYSAFPDIRDVTLIEIETIEALKRDHDADLPLHEHRRNLTTRGVPLNHLVGKRFWVGPVLLEGGRLNLPCRYLDMVTGRAVFELLTHRSGLNCRIVTGGEISLGDTIRPE
ncbi:MAG: MOSC domain-containing protein [Paracoccaceae bacterium]|nr:MOSC domain-containing protein [Paracoccaceae bacterium]MDH5530764.1 MOSC domain-containing protein [Paracoccaceae bacterium]